MSRDPDVVRMDKKKILRILSDPDTLKNDPIHQARRLQERMRREGATPAMLGTQKGFTLGGKFFPSIAADPDAIFRRLMETKRVGLGNPYARGDCGEFGAKCSSLMQFGNGICKKCPLRGMILPLTKGTGDAHLLPKGW